MKVYSLVGMVRYEGSDLLGVFGSLQELMKFVEDEREKCTLRSERKTYLGFDDLGYIESELGQKIDMFRDIEYL